MKKVIELAKFVADLTRAFARTCVKVVRDFIIKAAAGIEVAPDSS